MLLCRRGLINLTLGLFNLSAIKGKISLLSRSVSNLKFVAQMVQPIVFCGPSGVGKSTLLKRLMSEHPGCFAFSISHTTRNPRQGEINGKDYYFVTVDEMKKEIKENKFIEYVENYGNFYGTSIRAIKAISDSGRICVLDIDTNGVISIKKTDLNPKCVFIRPPCYEDLEKRLRGRGTETSESLEKRLQLAKKELLFGETPGIFDLVIINDDLEEAYKKLKEFLKNDISNVSSKIENKSA